ncbi:nuclear nucleic acid-binding protein C1D-like [Mya arenaria]|uniref:nuclear nucleic acid-binding protein C1D-like n=1 Tax=Mya arenaria TaxID=6604 RepID=UPI0022E34918|nr:nuclear nucleic acid-binding protein C1D-like [Mya arenaria]
MVDAEKGSDVPKELRGKLSAFDSALSDIENKFEPLLKMSKVEINTELSSLDKAKLDLVAAYSINSLFWMYLNVCGVNPKDHGIKQELDRIRGYMNRVKEVQDKEKAPKLNVMASKRFIKSALWQAAQKQDNEQDQETGSPTIPVEAESPSPSRGKRKSRSDEGSCEKKKKMDKHLKKPHTPKRYMNMNPS